MKSDRRQQITNADALPRRIAKPPDEVVGGPPTRPLTTHDLHMVAYAFGFSSVRELCISLTKAILCESR